MVDRTPQEFGGVPDGVTDSTAAIQAAIDAAGAVGDDVLISGGEFRTSDQLNCPFDGLRIKGDGGIRARVGSWTTHKALLEVTGTGVIVEGNGLTFDQNNIIPGGDSIRGLGAVGLAVSGVVSRGTQRAFLFLGDGCTDVAVADIDHLGRGYGVLANDPVGLARIVVRGSVFEHVGAGTAGDGIQFNCRTHGADQIDVIDVVARGYIGEATSQGIGIGFARVTNARAIGCLVEDCEGDGFHWERQSHDGVAFDCRALHCGRPDHVGGNGSGFIVYDSDRWIGESLLALDCWYHGIALSGQASITPPQGSVIFRCTALDTGRDCFHFTAQSGATIHRCEARDPSRNAPNTYAAYHLARQGGATLENVNCFGDDNSVLLTGATMPLGLTIVRPESINCLVNGVSGSVLEIRVTEDGDMRITESGEQRVLEAA
jgi:hypothetical protein